MNIVEVVNSQTNPSKLKEFNNMLSAVGKETGLISPIAKEITFVDGEPTDIKF